jgi:hypothetical protein
MIAVIDTGICNLRSVTKALETVGASIRVVQTPAALAAVAPAGLVLPGVGALRDCVASLRDSGMDAAVRDWIATDRPFLGICLGMQALFERSEEGNVAGLGIFPGEVVRFRRPATCKIPHMGWNTVRFHATRLAAARWAAGRRRVVLLRPQLPLRAARSRAGAGGMRLRGPVLRGDRPRTRVRDPVPSGKEPGDRPAPLPEFRHARALSESAGAANFP